MRINFYRSVTDAWGFAVHRFSLIARLAWFPVLLIIMMSLLLPYVLLTILNGQVVTITDISLADAATAIAKNQALLWEQHFGTMLALNVLSYVFSTLMYASFLVPLIRYTARGIEPSHRSVVLHIGPRHFKFLGATLLTVGSIFLLLWMPVMISTFFIDSHVADAMNTKYAVFPDADSLHSVEIVSGLESALGFALLKGVLRIVAVVSVLYFSLRFFAVPFFAGVREKGDSYHSIKASWALTRSWNAAKLACGLLVLGIAILIVTYLLNVYVLTLTATALQTMYALAFSSTGVMGTLGQDMAWVLDLIEWIWVVIRVVLNLTFLCFVFGIIAGLGGSLVRQSGLVGD
ncbi:hypothetical protein [Aquisalinus flavus]|nr:hypothetical protein [Aquisalinus flavus]MBD0427578.1 hypothetical protein [Aquisalinus flavus]UNE47370.1 hypothetical protein FF099_04480 [Aquisalinus flavus]